MKTKTKHSFEFKLAIVRKILKGDQSVTRISVDNHVDRSQAQRWVRFYERYGEPGLLPQYNNYSLQTKLSAIYSLRDKRLTLGQACVQFGIRSGSVLSRWIRIYESGGADELAIETRGTHKQMTSKNKKKDPIKPVANHEKVMEENRRLLAENAYLKKLHALIQREEAEKRKKH